MVGEWCIKMDEHDVRMIKRMRTKGAEGSSGGGGDVINRRIARLHAAAMHTSIHVEYKYPGCWQLPFKQWY